ncbi:MAG: hypothetical protein ACLP2X_23010 [Syntrophobacteraceae bacterium]
MPWYRVLIRGENFFMRLDGNVRRYGFYTSRLIEAPSLAELERYAVDHIQNDAQLRSQVLNSPDTPPEIYIEELMEVAPDTIPESQGSFAFFSCRD